jgi:hypothetical protein
MHGDGPLAGEPCEGNGYLAAHAALMIESFRRWTGRELIPPAVPPDRRARELFEARFVVVSHDASPDPVLTYGNRAALALWETDWKTLAAMPSRLTAEALERRERERLLDRVSRRGYIDDYNGIRISATGRRFRIAGATVWNLVDAAGGHRGQAAMFSRWEYL